MKDEKLEIKVFILDSKDPLGCKKEAMTLWGEYLLKIKGKPQIKIRVDSFAEPLLDIPRGYDLYIFHIGDLRGDDFMRLREEQPKSRMVGMGNAGDYDLYKKTGISTDYKQYFDEVYPGRINLDSREETRIIIDKVMKELK